MKSKSSLPRFVVLSFEQPEGERFAIFRQDDWLKSASPSQWGSPAAHLSFMEQFVRSLELLTEDTLRARLHDMGLGGDDATHQIVKARNMRQMNQGGSWERVTAPGYRNDDGQIVVARTSRSGGEPEQRVFVMRCSVCCYEYGTYGAEIPHRCCPNCQDGAPGLPI